MMRSSRSNDGEQRAADPPPQAVLEDLVHDVDGILWERDSATGRFTFVSRGAERLLGYPVDEWLAEPDFRSRRLVHPEDRERVDEVGRREAHAGRDHRIEYRAVTADGRLLWLRDLVRVVDGPEGRRLRGVSVDITDQKRVEEALSQQKEYYQDILDHIDIDFAVFDREGRFEYINPSAIRDPEVRQWAIGRTNVEYCRERGRPVAIGERRDALIEAAVREGETIEVEESMSTGDGGTRVILRRHFPLSDEDGRVVRVIGQGYDITDRKEAEEALRASEERFRLMVEGSEEVFFYELNTDHRFTYLSPSVRRVLGYRPEEILHQSYDDLMTEDRPDGPAHGGVGAAIGSLDQSVTFSIPVRHRDGAEVVLEILRRPVLRDGEVVGVQGFARDVTERRRGEAALRLERKKLETLLNAIPDIVWLKDEQSRFLTVNEALTEALGQPQERIIGRPDSDFFSPEMAEHYREDDLRVLRSGEQIRVNETVRKEDGSEMVVETIKVPFLNDEGVVVGTAGIARDVTDRKRAETALRESEARFRALIESVSDAIVVLDGDACMRYVSPAFERITGYSSEASVGRSAIEQVHPDDVAAAERAWRHLLRSAEGSMSVELRVRRRDGAWRRVEITGKNLLDDPIIGGAVVTYHDVTERRSLEEQLRGAQKMEAVGRLAGGIAHDFNNVMTAIRGHAQFVLEDAPASESVQADIGEIIQCTERAHNLTRQLLAFSRQQPSEQRVISPERVIRSAENMLRRLIGEDIELEVAVADDVGRIVADPTQMEQVLVNLAINARDAMPRGGRLNIGVENVTVSDDQAPGIPIPVVSGRYVRLTVADTGSGIDEETQEHIFEPFFTTKPLGAGTGLGLSTVYGVVKQARGYVGLTSEMGVGTTFYIYLPYTEEDVAEIVEREPAPASTGGSETVLLVEDQASVRTLARRVLERAGYRVLEAESGRQALDLWGDEDRGAVDLLLTDVVMPQMGGKALSRRLREQCPALKVLYMSGYAEEHIAHRGILEPGANLLEKPFDPETLRARVRSLLDRAPDPVDPA